ncbi:chromosome segregation protein SMC [Enterococcus sp.]|uniref:chromosome segregation protein SMC n=1 Tax=Enterococcus sp. TaxID=35783 RepID=UPI0025C51ADD|nr:chromosome segregation protein SMC [Enterococcus sp.]
MYLKRIEIAGFKSFADRTIIDFENSVTAVVGPNGSGKSNITEAIRWVLGEQSAKSLRGGKMPDIIFAGSDTRKPLNVAEVTIILDNTDHYLPLDYSEISVTRRLRRTGESDFYLNKQSCRLRDVQELFMDSGLGKESFSIISQGKVEAIFSSKPEDRRGIFEEAAGVLKYKQRKKKAEQKLFETEDNLSRLQDIIYELEDQLIPLAAQSEAAKQFLSLKEKLTEIDVAFSVMEIETAKAAWETATEQLEQLNRQLAEITQQINNGEGNLQQLRLRRTVFDESLEQINQQLLQVTEGLKQAEGQKEVLLERSKHTQKSTAEYQETLDAVSERLQQLNEEKAELIHELSQKNRSVQEAEVAIADCRAEQVKYQKSAKEIIEELRSQYVEAMQEQATIGNELKYLERQYQQETAKNQTAVTKQTELATAIKEKATAAEIVNERLQGIQQQLDEQRKQYIHLQEKAKDNKEKLDDAQKKMYQLMNQVQQVRAKQRSLQDIQENYAGFYQGVRVILKNKQQLTGVVGAVAELIEVPEKYTVAIETALGASAQHVVVETERDARAAITYLKENRGGRATFLPLTTIKSRQLPSYAVSQAQQVPGFIGIASELVRFNDEVKTIAENLLGSIVIAEDLKSANALAKALNYSYRVVSLEGDVMNAGGSMTGGATKKNAGSLFSQSNELQQLTAQAAQLDERLQKTEKQVQHFETVTKDAQSALEELRTTGETARMTEHELKNQLQNLTNELERLKKEQQVFDFENREIQAFFEEYHEKKTRLEAEQQTISQQLKKIDQDIQSMNAEEDLIEAKRSQLAETAAQLQADFAVQKEQVAHLKQKITANAEALAENEARQQSLERQLAAINSNNSDHEVTEESLDQQISDFTERKMTLTQELAEIRQQRQTVQQEIGQLDEALSLANLQQKEKLSEKTNVEIEKNRADLVMDNRLAYLQEEYALSFEKAANDYSPIEDPETAKSEIQELKGKIDAIGPVNLNAIEQYDQVEQRHSFLTSQRDDLLSAKAQLFDTMSEMDEEVKTRFGEVFEAIRLQFKQVFPNMFGGGHAELILTDPKDLLNTGIEIEAQPPGKKLQNLSLLSGGERALTAIALLFSIIQVRPVPFCVLDEVEAALDEANVSRFGHYLSDFQNDTQFIVVTHRKGTMEAADVLYGVTMQESGVSKTVSVRLEDVKEGGNFVAEQEGVAK